MATLLAGGLHYIRKRCPWARVSIYQAIWANLWHFIYLTHVNKVFRKNRWLSVSHDKPTAAAYYIYYTQPIDRKNINRIKLSRSVQNKCSSHIIYHLSLCYNLVQIWRVQLILFLSMFWLYDSRKSSAWIGGCSVASRGIHGLSDLWWFPRALRLLQGL